MPTNRKRISLNLTTAQWDILSSDGNPNEIIKAILANHYGEKWPADTTRHGGPRYAGMVYDGVYGWVKAEDDEAG